MAKKKAMPPGAVGALTNLAVMFVPLIIDIVIAMSGLDAEQGPNTSDLGLYAMQFISIAFLISPLIGLGISRVVRAGLADGDGPRYLRCMGRGVLASVIANSLPIIAMTSAPLFMKKSLHAPLLIRVNELVALDRQTLVLLFGGYALMAMLAGAVTGLAVERQATR